MGRDRVREAVCVLQHSRALAGGKEESKLIGIYRTLDAAEAAIERLVPQPGFREFASGFCIEMYELDHDVSPISDGSRKGAVKHASPPSDLMSCFVLFHVTEFEDESETVLIVGIYRSQELAETAARLLSQRHPNRKLPARFEIVGYPLGKDHWSEGFVTDDE